MKIQNLSKKQLALFLASYQKAILDYSSEVICTILIENNMPYDIAKNILNAFKMSSKKIFYINLCSNTIQISKTYDKIITKDKSDFINYLMQIFFDTTFGDIFLLSQKSMFEKSTFKIIKKEFLFRVSNFSEEILTPSLEKIIE